MSGASSPQDAPAPGTRPVRAADGSLSRQGDGAVVAFDPAAGQLSGPIGTPIAPFHSSHGCGFWA